MDVMAKVNVNAFIGHTYCTLYSVLYSHTRITLTQLQLHCPIQTKVSVIYKYAHLQQVYTHIHVNAANFLIQHTLTKAHSCSFVTELKYFYLCGRPTESQHTPGRADLHHYRHKHDFISHPNSAAGWLQRGGGCRLDRKKERKPTQTKQPQREVKCLAENTLNRIN